MIEKPKKRRIPSVAACRETNSRDPNGAPNGRLAEIERVARELIAMPPDERLSAAMRAFPPSQLREALWHYARGASPAEACKQSGCNPNGFELYLKSGNVGHDLRQVMKGVLECAYAPAAFAFLNATVGDTAVPARVRVDAAKIIVDRAGCVAGPPAPDAAHKDLQSMSLAELEAFIRKAGAKLKDVTPARPDDESADDAPADDTPPQPH